MLTANLKLLERSPCAVDYGAGLGITMNCSANSELGATCWQFEQGCSKAVS
jgi:hypothetical protein